MKIVQTKYLVKKNLPHYFNKISWYSQKSLNINIEETIGLLIEISHLLLDGYDNIMKNFISNPIKRVTKKKMKKVYDEKKEFITNIAFFSEAFVFLQVCYETYNTIIANNEENKINTSNFEKIFQYLDRARFTVSKICLDLKNIYIEQTQEDKNIIDNCLKNIKNLSRKNLYHKLNKIDRNNNILNFDFYNIRNIKKQNRQNKYNNIKSKINCHQKFSLFNSGINSFSYKGLKKLKLSEEHLINNRINNALLANSKKELKPNKNFIKFNVNSKLVDELMKYATKEFKSKIISERLRQKLIISESAD